MGAALRASGPGRTAGRCAAPSSAPGLDHSEEPRGWRAGDADPGDRLPLDPGLACPRSGAWELGMNPPGPLPARARADGIVRVPAARMAPLGAWLRLSREVTHAGRALHHGGCPKTRKPGKAAAASGTRVSSSLLVVSLPQGRKHGIPAGHKNKQEHDAVTPEKQTGDRVLSKKEN